MAIQVHGQLVDSQTRCAHWHSQLDVVALKFKCCDRYYACFSCHEEDQRSREHEVRRYHVKWDPLVKVVLCGVCKLEMTFEQYLGAGGLRCPSCGVQFNPGCKLHHSLYFDGIDNV